MYLCAIKNIPLYVDNKRFRERELVLVLTLSEGGWEVRYVCTFIAGCRKLSLHREQTTRDNDPVKPKGFSLCNIQYLFFPIIDWSADNTLMNIAMCCILTVYHEMLLAAHCSPAVEAAYLWHSAPMCTDPMSSLVPTCPHIPLTSQPEVLRQRRGNIAKERHRERGRHDLTKGMDLGPLRPQTWFFQNTSVQDIAKVSQYCKNIARYIAKVLQASIII